MQETKKPHLTATQRLEGLESAVMTLDAALANLTQTVGTIKQAIKLLSSKVDAVVVAGERKLDLSNSTVESLMIEENVRDLKSRVEGMTASGIVKPAATVGSNGFVVGRELNRESRAVANPRIQFAMRSLSSEAMKSQLLGLAPGALVDFGGEENLLEIEEVYEIVEESAQPQQATETPAETQTQDQAV